MLVALMLMSALLALACCLGSLAVLELRQQDVALRSHRLRRATDNALALALAEAQLSLGPDAAYTSQDASGALRVAGKFGSRILTGDHTEGSVRVRWEVEDLSMANDAAARWVAAGQASAWARTSAGRSKLPRALAEPMLASQKTALVAGRVFAGVPPTAGGSWQIRGLLTDPVRGGWRRNLSASATAEAEWGRPLAELMGSPSFVVSPAKGYPLMMLEAPPFHYANLPVLADFRLSLGFFNSRTDGRHRLRFHGSAVFWNPYAVPVLAGPQGRLFLVEVVGAPEVTVTNVETQSTFVVDLDDCPQEDFGIIRQGLRERGLWCWAEVSDPSTYGMSGRGLLPGEVFALVNPPPESQPQGLARILTRMTWRLDRGYHGPGWRRPEPTIFLPTDRIEIAVRFRDKVSVRLRANAGDPARDEAIGNYPGRPLLTLSNIVFPDFLIRTTGEDYSREDSSGYVIGERRACLRVRLRPRSPQELKLSKLSQKNWDFSQAADASEWVVDHPVIAALDVVDHDASPLQGALWDLRANHHDGELPGAHASLRMGELPGWPTLSVGSSRHFEPSGSTAWRSRLDAAFHGAPLGSPQAGVISHNPFLCAASGSVDVGAPEASRGLYVVGPFNVNAKDAKEWEAFFRDAVGVWTPDAGGPFAPRELRGASFFTRPTGASLAKWAARSPIDLADTEVVRLTDDARGGLVTQQCVRVLGDDKLAELARRIVEGQITHGWPYPSLQAFAESGLLEWALRESGVNDAEELAGSEVPFVLRSEDLLEAWAPVLAVRGDTLRLVASAEGEGGACVGEWIVQRVAEEHEATLLGRRFRIISVRYRNP